MPRGSRRRNPPGRSQSGFTLVEVLVVVAVTGLLVVPLAAWIALAARTSGDVQRSEADSAVVSLLSTYLGRDVSGASTVVRGGTGTCSSGSGNERLVTITQGDASRALQRITYEIETDPRGGRLLRVVCPDGGAVQVAEIVDRLEQPSGGWGELVRCAARPEISTTPCAEVEFRVPSRSGAPLRVSGVVRVGRPR